MSRRSSVDEAVGNLTALIAANKFVNLLKKRVRQKVIYQTHYKIDKDYKPPSIDRSEEDEKLILKALKKNFFLRDKTKREMKRLVKCFEECSHQKGEQFINQGDNGDYFYVLKNGGVRFVVDGVTVSKANKPGVSFGEMSLLFTSPRAASVVTTEDSDFFRVGQRDFRFIMQRQTQSAGEDKFNLLEGVNFLKDVSPFDLKRLGAAMTPHLFGPDTILERKGDPGKRFWIIQEGQVEVLDKEIGSTRYEDDTLGAGDHFGSRALATDEPREATFRSLTSGVAFTIDRETFEKVLGSMTALVLKAEDARHLGGIEFFRQAKLDASQLTVLSNLISHKGFQKDQFIVEAGKKTKPAIYFVREGEVSVQTAGGKELVVKRGGYFGEELMNTAEGQIHSSVESTITAKVKETCVCGILTLRDCRTMFDTEGAEPEVEIVSESKGKVTKRMGRTRQKSERIVLPAAPDGFKRHLVLGEGTFGQVRLVIWHSMYSPWKIKITHSNFLFFYVFRSGLLQMPRLVSLRCARSL